ncbi:hypothetical protein K456DRAFT_267865 [Colletotrichum gloeosporioides 23]|nr:hypothetical protein K456DRAFT_267865 [Colletotrichum gloeosporioides 23]
MFWTEYLLFSKWPHSTGHAGISPDLHSGRYVRGMRSMSSLEPMSQTFSDSRSLLKRTRKNLRLLIFHYSIHISLIVAAWSLRNWGKIRAKSIFIGPFEDRKVEQTTSRVSCFQFLLFSLPSTYLRKSPHEEEIYLAIFGLWKGHRGIPLHAVLADFFFNCKSSRIGTNTTVGG